MPTSKETQAWLEDLKAKGNLSAEELDAMTKVFSKPEVDEFAKGSVLRQSDYSRQMNRAQADFKTKLDQIEAYEKSLGDWRNKTEAQVRADQEALLRVTQEAEGLKRLALSYGIEEAELMTTVPIPKQEPKHEPQVDLSKDYLKRSDWEQAAAAYPLIVGEVNDIVAEYSELFGKPLKNSKEIVEQAMREGRSIREVYETKFEVSARRQEINDQAKEAEIKRRVDEELIKYRTENSLPMPRPQGVKGDAFQVDVRTLPEAGFNEAQSKAESVRAAVATWQGLAHQE